VQQHAEVINDVLEASASLAGLALVFLGMIATATASNDPSDRRGPVPEKARRPVYAILLAFSAGILCVATAAVWLVALQSALALYVVTIALFFLQLGLLLFATGWSIRRVLQT
jgi:small-conductance mechanosensitive channel